MGCKIECTICCKKKKKEGNTIPIERKDTKFVAEGFQHLKIEIKNNNSNSKEIPLINNFSKKHLVGIIHIEAKIKAVIQKVKKVSKF